MNSEALKREPRPRNVIQTTDHQMQGADQGLAMEAKKTRDELTVSECCYIGTKLRQAAKVHCSEADQGPGRRLHVHWGRVIEEYVDDRNVPRRAASAVATPVNKFGGSCLREDRTSSLFSRSRRS